MIRFYQGGLSLADVRAMTLKQFTNWILEANKLNAAESGETIAQTPGQVKSMLMADPAVRKQRRKP